MDVVVVYTEERAVRVDGLVVGREGSVDQVHDRLVSVAATDRQAANQHRLLTPRVLGHQGGRPQGNVESRSKNWIGTASRIYKVCVNTVKLHVQAGSLIQAGGLGHLSK